MNARRLALALVLLVGLGASLPAAVAGERRTLATNGCVAPSVVLGTRTAQLVTVTASSRRATTAVLRAYQRVRGCFRPVAGPVLAFVGRNGLSSQKREGDGTTPLGNFALGEVAYGIEPNPGVHLGYHRLVCGDWWDEDPSSANYNRFVHVRCGTTPSFRGDSEALWQIAPAYDYFAVIDYNTSPVRAGRGSAIFLHVATGGATDGCVSVPVTTLRFLLRWLRASAGARIVISVR